MPARYDCEICRGRGLITLPLYPRATAASGASFEPPAIAEAACRDYPCPECGDVIPLERLATVEFHSQCTAYITDPEFREHAKRWAAHGLVDALLAKRFIVFRRGPEDQYAMTIPMRATIGVVSPTHVATLEERIRERQDAIARETVAEARQLLSQWGPGVVDKRQAIGDVERALRHVLERRAETPA